MHRHVGDGAQAVQRFDARRFSAVLMDCRLPVMDGYEAVRLIRCQPRFENLPIIAMTANAFAKDRQRCLEAGMDDYLSKPVEPEQLDLAINHWYQRKK